MTFFNRLFASQAIGGLLTITLVACTPPHSPQFLSSDPLSASSDATGAVADSESATDFAEGGLFSATAFFGGSIEEDEAPKADCDEPVTQKDMNMCARDAYIQTDSDLTATYGALMLTLPATGQDSLGTAEAHWRGFRELDCAFVRDKYIGGSIAPMMYNDCLASRTIERTEELSGSPALSFADYDDVDARLNAQYQTLMGALGAPRQAQLVSAQRAWILYRDSNCAFEAVHHPKAIDKLGCMTRMSETRTEHIENVIAQSEL